MAEPVADAGAQGLGVEEPRRALGVRTSSETCPTPSTPWNSPIPMPSVLTYQDPLGPRLSGAREDVIHAGITVGGPEASGVPVRERDLRDASAAQLLGVPRATMTVHGRRRHHRRSRPGRARGQHELVRRGQAGGHPRPGDAAQPRRPGVLVPRRAVPCGHPEQRRHGRARTPSSWRWQDWLGTAQFDRLDDEDPWPRSGRAPTSTSRPARSGPGCRRMGLQVLPAGRLGRARRRPAPAGTATLCPASTSPGAPGTGVFEPFDDRPGPPRRAGWSASLPAPGRRARVDGGSGHRRARRRPGAGRRRARLRRRTGTRSATSSSAPRRSIVTTGGIGGNHELVRKSGRSGSARRRSRWSPASPRTSTAGCWASPRRPASGWSTPTGCGTTPRDSATGTRSGRTTASGSCPALVAVVRRRWAPASRAAACPATTPWAP